MICEPCKAGDHCNSASCFCQHHPPGTAQEQGQPVPQEPSGASLVQGDPPAPPRESQSRTGDPDLYVSPGFNRTVQDVPTVELLADWMRSVRSHQKARAAVLHGALAARLGRLK